jgi:protocatechuate 3,4-dioxygenase beta subunit
MIGRPDQLRRVVGTAAAIANAICGSICASSTAPPASRARVDIAHADARGIYSGYEGQGDKQDLSTIGQKFFRGTQFTDGKGAVSFATIEGGLAA